MARKVFVSYSRKDADKVRGLVLALIEAGCHVHLDAPKDLGVPAELLKHCTGIRGRHDWQAELGRIMGECDDAVICMSQRYLDVVDTPSVIFAEVKAALLSKRFFVACLEAGEAKGQVGIIISHSHRRHRPFSECDAPAEFYAEVIQDLLKPDPPSIEPNFSLIAHLADRTTQIEDTRSFLAREGERDVIICPGVPEELPQGFGKVLATAWIPLLDTAEWDVNTEIYQAIFKMIDMKPGGAWDYKPITLCSRTFENTLEKFWQSLTALTNSWSVKKGVRGAIVHLHVPAAVWRKSQGRKLIAQVIAKRPQIFRDRDHAAIFMISVDTSPLRPWLRHKKIPGADRFTDLASFSSEDIWNWLGVIRAVAVSQRWGSLNHLEAAIRPFSQGAREISMGQFAAALHPLVERAASSRTSG